MAETLPEVAEDEEKETDNEDVKVYENNTPEKTKLERARSTVEIKSRNGYLFQKSSHDSIKF